MLSIKNSFAIDDPLGSLGSDGNIVNFRYPDAVRTAQESREEKASCDNSIGKKK